MSLLFTITLSAASNARIKLPDGLYMYDSWISHAMGASVRFEKFFVVKNNDIYFSEQAIKKFGLSKLNESFTKNKKYKILLCGEKVGKIDKLKVGQVSQPFDFSNEQGKKGFKIIKLKARYKAHKANLSDDYNYLQQLTQEHKKQEAIKNWILKKMKTTYFTIDDDFKKCEFNLLKF